MSTSDDIKKRRDLNTAFLVGQKILGIKFRYNSRVAFRSQDDIRVEGWIVSVGPLEPEPSYTVERCDGGGDEEVAESKLELVLDPHELSKG